MKAEFFHPNGESQVHAGMGGKGGSSGGVKKKGSVNFLGEAVHDEGDKTDEHKRQEQIRRKMDDVHSSQIMRKTTAHEMGGADFLSRVDAGKKNSAKMDELANLRRAKVRGGGGKYVSMYASTEGSPRDEISPLSPVMPGGL